MVSGYWKRETLANSMVDLVSESITFPLISGNLSRAKDVLIRKFKPGIGMEHSKRIAKKQKILLIKQNKY
jgi:hypothetical protein